MSVDHYENFPVASILCPPALRPPILAIYGFARTADDMADEGDAPAESRLADLAQYRGDLLAAATGQPGSGRWATVFEPLARAMHSHALPLALLEALLDAFEQDVRQPTHPDRGSLLDYCSHSANPIGRLLLHLYGVGDAESLRRSDAICTALQLINFWQDLSVDLPRGRRYLPESDCRRLGLRPDAPAADSNGAAESLLRELSRWTRDLMLDGAPLVHRMPGRVGWELRLVVQGGLLVLDKVDALGAGVFARRPTVGASDGPRLLWRALRM